MRSCLLRVLALCTSLSCGVLPACGGARGGGGDEDDGGRRDAGTILSIDAGASTDEDGGTYVPMLDGGPGAACAPSGGSASTTLFCDEMLVAVLARDGAPSQVRIEGRLASTGLPGGCAVVESVELYESTTDSPLVQRFEGSLSVPMDSVPHLFATGPVTSALTDRCATGNAMDRFEPFGVVVRGRVDGGTFEARCSRARGGAQWPPSLALTCHRNVELPVRAASASAQILSFMGMTFRTSSVYAVVPHGPGGELTSVDGSIHVLPLRAFFASGAPLMARDITGWMASVSETTISGTASSISLSAASGLLGEDLCPLVRPGGPAPGEADSPVFIARFSGRGPHGAYSTEALVRNCSTSVSMPMP